MKSLVTLLLILCLGWPLSGRAEDQRVVTSVAVMPFVKLKGDKDAWLDKAIADLVAQKLTESDSYAVLNRDALQTFIKEMQFQQSGFVENVPTLARVGKIARVDQVIYGNYAMEGSRIVIHLMVMDVASQKVRQQKEVGGALGSLMPLCSQLVDELLATRSIELTPQERANIAFTPTDSLSAMEHFYNGLHAYDQGDYEKASGEFFASTRQDPDYLDARLWFARMLEQTGRDEEAIATYLELYAKAPESVEGIDSRYFAARLLARAKPEEAARTYQTLADIHPEIPETLEAAYQAASLYRDRGDVEKAYLLYKQIDDFSQRARKHTVAYNAKGSMEANAALPALRKAWNSLIGNDDKASDPEQRDMRSITAQTRHSRFFAWDHALGLYREAITQMVKLYRDLPLQNGISYAPPRGSFVVDPANPIIAGDVKEKDKSLFGGDHTYDERWKETFFAVIVPKGYVATGADLELTGRLPDPTMSRDFTLRVLPFPLPQSYQNGWLGVIYGQTPTTSTLNKEVPFFGKDQKLLALQLVENYGEIHHWQVKIRLNKEAEVSAFQNAAKTEANVEGSLLAKLRLGNNRTFESMPQYLLQEQPNQKLAMTEDSKGGVWLVGVKGELWSHGTDLWIAHSDNGGKRWAAAEPMNVNSGSHEFAPTLLRAEDGTLRLFFLSNRRGLGWELWTSGQDKKSNRWEHPALVPIRDFAATGYEDDGMKPHNLLPYAAMQDSHGQWLVAAGSRATRQLIILASDDLTHWRQHAILPNEDAVAVALGQDRTDRYYMVSQRRGGASQIRYSNDGKTWTTAGAPSLKILDPHFPVTLLKRGSEGMTALFSDNITGLQYTPVAPMAAFAPDLVTASGLEPYAAAAVDDGVLVALWKDDDIYIQRYNKFAFAENSYNNPNEIIYTERSRDKDGGVWDRIFARERYRVPDVTVVGAAPEDRVWWGIETGIMSLKGSEFFVSDVSEGFFSHYIDTIKRCGEMTWFAASNLGRPQVGYSAGRLPSASSVGKPMLLSEISGAVTAIACGGKGETYFASSHGEILSFSLNEQRRRFEVPERSDAVAVLSLAYDMLGDRLLAGTSDGHLYAMNRKGGFSPLKRFKHPVRSIAIDPAGMIWVAVEEEGIAAFTADAGNVTAYKPPAIPATIRRLVSAQKSGVWAIADSHASSPGLMHVDQKAVTFFNPPQKNLDSIVDFDVAEDGTIWIGTNLDGIYHYRGAQ